MRQTLNALLGAGLDVSEQEFVEKVTPRLLALGIDVEDATYQDVMLAGILMKAIRGDVRAAEFIRDTGGDSPHLDMKKQELKLRKEELRELLLTDVQAGTQQGIQRLPHGFSPPSGRPGRHAALLAVFHGFIMALVAGKRYYGPLSLFGIPAGTAPIWI